MKITIFYFSGTGNTYFAANSLRDALIQKGAEARALSIEKLSAEDTASLINQSDKIVIGYPIYGSTAPKLMREFMEALPVSNCLKPASIITTIALYSGDGAILYRKLLKQKGYAYDCGVEFIMPNNINIPGFPDMLRVGDDEKVNRQKSRTVLRANYLAELLINNRHAVKYDRVFGRMMGALQRKYVDDYIQKLSSTYYTEDSKCIKCMRCVKMCPVDNIRFEDGKILFGSQCMGCMRCYHFCPTAAINITEKSLDTKKWPRYKSPDKDYIKTLL